MMHSIVGSQQDSPGIEIDATGIPEGSLVQVHHLVARPFSSHQQQTVAGSYDVLGSMLTHSYSCAPFQQCSWCVSSSVMFCFTMIRDPIFG